MKLKKWALAGGAVLLAAVFLVPGRNNPERPEKIGRKIRMEIKSKAFVHQGWIPVKYTCDGEDVSPPLSIRGTPPAAKSLALIVDDPDAPAGTWVHWLVWNIDPAVRVIKEGELPAEVVLGTNDFRRRRWGSPCPPDGTHRYFFRLYALDRRLSLPPGAGREELEAAMRGHILTTAELMGRYRRGGEAVDFGK